MITASLQLLKWENDLIYTYTKAMNKYLVKNHNKPLDS